jgi:phosphoenolpyruvate carboxylase
MIHVCADHAKHWAESVKEKVPEAQAQERRVFFAHALAALRFGKLSQTLYL